MSLHRRLPFLLLTAFASGCVLPHATGVDVQVTDIAADDGFDVPNERRDIVDVLNDNDAPVVLDEDVVLPLDGDAALDVPDPIDAPDVVDVPNPIDIPDVPTDIPNRDVPNPDPDAGVLPIKWSVDFTAIRRGTALSLPENLQLFRASAATVQVAPDSVTTAVVADQARIGEVDAVAQGLVLEEGRTNRLCFSRNFGTNANPGGCEEWKHPDNIVSYTADVATGPDMVMSADRFDATNVIRPAYSRGSDANGAMNRPVVGSFWARRNDMNRSAASALRVSDNVNEEPNFPITLQDSWRRFSDWTQRNSRFFPMDLRAPMQAGQVDQLVDMAQLEEGFWPSEYIAATPGTPGTRAGERLLSNMPSRLYSVGQLSLEFDLVPKGASTEYLAPMRLFTVDANNYAEIDNGNGRLTITLGGMSNTFTQPLVWSRGQRVQIYVGTSPVAAAYAVNGGVVRFAELTLPGAARGTLGAAGATMDLLCSGTTNQFSAWVRSISAYTTGIRPRYN